MARAIVSRIALGSALLLAALPVLVVSAGERGPMLAVSGGATWLLSTPNGARGFFWEAWEHGGPDWERSPAR